MRASRENAKPTLLRRVLACLVSAAMVVAFTPVVAWGGTQVGDFTVSGGVSGTDYAYENNTLTIKSSTPITISNTDPNTATTDHIVVDRDVTADITLDNASIDVSAFDDVCAFSISNSSTVHLNLARDNTLQSGKNTAGLQVPSDSSLTIASPSGTGSLTANGGTNGAGIGAVGDSEASCGNITIKSGTIIANGRTSSAGIGGSNGSAGSNITINGGTVTATGGGGGAGIGGGNGNHGNNITISGGTITAIGGGDGGAGIGGGNGGGSGGNITINGGTVTATSTNGAGIGCGGGEGGSSSAFSTSKDGKAGNAVIFASSIGDQSGKGNWSGVIFEGDTGEVYGSPTLLSDLTFPGAAGTATASAKTLTVPENKTLTIAKDTTLTIANGGTLTNNGTIINKGTITNNGTLTNNGAIINNGGTITGSVSSGNQPKDGASADYLDEGGNIQTCDTAIVVTASDTEWRGGDADNPVWYVVKSDVTIGDGNNPTRVKVNGNVNLILADGCTLSATYGIEVSDPNSLTVYGQQNGTGTLRTEQNAMGENAGIGGSADEGNRNCGTVTINGGTINANAQHGAGIGGGGSSQSDSTGGSGGTITINDGTVTTYSSRGGAGIGGGYGVNAHGSAGTIAINGGAVESSGSNYGVGIGGNGGSVSIKGGVVTAYASVAGIGGGSRVCISGGVVTARSSDGGVGIGGTTNNSGSFNTGTNGNAVVFAEKITDQSGKADGSWSGVIIECDTISLPSSGPMTVSNGKGKVYGSSVTPTENFTVPSGATLTIPESTALTIASGKTLTNEGTIYVDGLLSGKVEGNGAVYYPLTLKDTTATGDISTPEEGKTYGKAGSEITLAAGTAPAGKEFGGWATTPANITVSGDTFTMPNQATEVAAQWRDIYVPPSDPSYNVPGSGEGGVAVKVTVSGSTAVVAEISASALESAAGSGAATVTIDLSGLPKGVTQAQLSKSTVDKLLAVVMNEGNAVESVTVNLGGAVLTIDAKALAAISEQVKGANVTLGVKESTPDSLNSAQSHALSPFEVVQLYFEASIKSGGTEIHDFGGGSVRVSVAFAPRPGHNPARYVVLYVGEDGAIERYATAWAAGMLSFMAPHFSAYAVVYVEDEAQAAIQLLEALPVAGELKASQATEAVKRAEDALVRHAALDDGQKMLVDEALVANAQEVVAKGAELIEQADAKAVGKVKDKAFSVKAGKSKSIAFKTKASAAGTKVTYKKASGSKYISVTKTGKVTAKKGMKKGKTYTAKVKVVCGEATKTVKVTVKAK